MLETALAVTNQCVVLKGVPTAATKRLAGKQVEAAGSDSTRGFRERMSVSAGGHRCGAAASGLVVGSGLAV